MKDGERMADLRTDGSELKSTAKEAALAIAELKADLAEGLINDTKVERKPRTKRAVANGTPSTHTLSAQARERQRYAAGLVAAALLGHRLAGRAMGGGAGPEDPSASRTVRRVLVGLVVALHAARAARRARRGGVVACGCAPVFVRARVKVK